MKLLLLLFSVLAIALVGCSEPAPAAGKAPDEVKQQKDPTPLNGQRTSAPPLPGGN